MLPEFKADPFGYLKHLGEVYGDVYRVPLPLYDVVVVNHPDHVRHIMNFRDGEYSMLGPAGWVRSVLGASMAMLEGEQFRKRRRSLTPMMGRGQLSKIATVVAEEFADRLQRWNRFAETGETIDLQEKIAGVIVPAFMRAMYSVRLPDAELRRLDADIRLLVRTEATPLGLAPPPRLLPGEGNPVQAWRRVRRWVRQKVEQRLADTKSYDDMLEMIVDARYPDGQPISRRDTITETTILMGAGYETVVAALSWTLALLPQNPRAQQRLYEEVDELGGAMPTYEDLDRLQWAKACFDEGQRLQGTLFHPRFAMIDDTIGGYRIRRGSLIGTTPYALQRDSRWWGPDADSYEPTRFYDKDIVAARPNLAFIPFGAGPHRCFGAALGYLEGQFLLAQIHQRFRTQTPAGWAPRHDRAIPWPVNGGVPAVLTRAPVPVK